MVEFHKGERIKMSTLWLGRKPMRMASAASEYRGVVVRERKGAVRVKWNHSEQTQLLACGFIERAA
jgi:hypothetical protein